MKTLIIVTIIQNIIIKITPVLFVLFRQYICPKRNRPMERHKVKRKQSETGGTFLVL